MAALEISQIALVALGVGAVVFASMCLFRLLAGFMDSKRPPIFEGIPFIGGVLKFAEGPMKLMADGHKACGEVFTVPVLHKRVTFMIGPDVSAHFFKAPDEELNQHEVYAFNVPTFGPGVVFDVPQKVRIEQFRFFTEALTKDRLRKYVPQFVSEAEQYFNTQWKDEGVVDLGDEFCKLVTLTAARTLLGREVREQLFEQVATLLHHLDEGMLPISVFLPYLPIPAHAKRDRARKELSSIFAKIIRARRANGNREDDVLQQFIDAKYQNVYNGRATTEEEITGLLIAVLFAGQHTSSITTAWTAYHIIADKTRGWNPCLAEQKQIMREFGTELNFDVLSREEVLHRCVTEALRIHPPLLLLLRAVKQSFAVTTKSGKEYVVPKGDIVAASPNYSHTLSYVFKNPLEFDPDRFIPPREEDKVKPFSFIGFGGGRHACLGQNFAYLQVKTIISVLMRNFEFELVDPVPEPNYDTMVIGPKPCKVKYIRRKLVV